MDLLKRPYDTAKAALLSYLDRSAPHITRLLLSTKSRPTSHHKRRQFGSAGSNLCGNT